MRWLLTLCALISLPAFAANPLVKVETSKGDIVIELYADKAPKSVANFLQYVDDGFYNGTVFHRIIDGFMIQGGGFDQQYQQKATRPAVENEADNGLINRRGTIAMARTNDPHSATAQFFINTVNNNSLDHRDKSQRGWGYTVFGRVTKGLGIVDIIEKSQTGSGSLGGYPARDVPRDAIVIKTVSRVAEGKPAAAPAKKSEADAEPTSK
jgi:cyclophilin family peptidyl-prolyl cis-trans isomerase